LAGIILDKLDSGKILSDISYFATIMKTTNQLIITVLTILILTLLSSPVTITADNKFQSSLQTKILQSLSESSCSTKQQTVVQGCDDAQDKKAHAQFCCSRGCGCCTPSAPCSLFCSQSTTSEGSTTTLVACADSITTDDSSTTSSSSSSNSINNNIENLNPSQSPVNLPSSSQSSSSATTLQTTHFPTIIYSVMSIVFLVKL
jgi:hypothetical protein